jgi:DNA-binding NarL/FixJ family response regulator
MEELTRFVVVTDCTMLVMGFEALAEWDADLALVGTGSDTHDVVQLIDRAGPDVVVIDRQLSDDRAVPLCEMISNHKPRVAILVISPDLDDEAVRGAIEAGARGFVYKDMDRSELAATLKRLASGEAVLDPRVTGRVIGWAAKRSGEIAEDGLSGREAEVVRRVAKGESNKQIAKRLGLTENTVKTYLRRAYQKLDCQTRSAAAALAAQRGLL